MWGYGNSYQNIAIIIIGPSKHSGLDQKHPGIQPRKPRSNDATVSVWKSVLMWMCVCVYVRLCMCVKETTQSPGWQSLVNRVLIVFVLPAFPVLFVRNVGCSSTDRRSAFLPQLAAGWVIVYRPFHSAMLSNDGDATFPLNHNLCMSLHDTKLGLSILYKMRYSLSHRPLDHPVCPLGICHWNLSCQAL